MVNPIDAPSHRIDDEVPKIAFILQKPDIEICLPDDLVEVQMMIFEKPLVDDPDVGFDSLLNLLISRNGIIDIQEFISFQLYLTLLTGHIQDTQMFPK